MANGKEKELPSFWLPSQSPAAKNTKFEKPDPTILCPVSQKPIKAKDLIHVEFTLVKDPADKKSLIVKENRYMCAVTHDILSNSVPCAVLRPTWVLTWIVFLFLFWIRWKKKLMEFDCSGHVVTMECVEKLIKKDMIHPLTSIKLKEKDIIPLQRVSIIDLHQSIVTFIYSLSIFPWTRVGRAIHKRIHRLKLRKNDQHWCHKWRLTFYFFFIF